MKAINILIIATLIALSCNNSNDAKVEPIVGGNCLVNGTNTSIANNHGHAIAITADEIDLAIAKTYNIQGASSHSHQVTVSSDNYLSLKSNSGVEVASTTDSGHSHLITINCAE